MFRRRLTTFRPATGAFKPVMKPYRRWHDRTDMSAAFELDGEVYRVVITVEFLGTYPRYLVACDEQGNVIADKDITRQCFRIYTYLGRFALFKSIIHTDLQQSRRDTKHRPLIEAFQEINETLSAHLTDQERQHFDFHLYYLQEVRRLSQSIGRYAAEMLKMEKKLNSLNPNYMSPALVEEAITLIDNYTQERDKLMIILFEDAEPRKTVLQVLQRSVKANNVPYRYRRWVLNEIHEASAAAQRLLTEVQQQRSNISSFEGNIDYLKNVSPEKYVEMIVASLLDEDWPLKKSNR